MRAKTISGNSEKQIGAALSDCMADGFHPTLAIVFISVKQDRKAICALLDSKEIDVFGATSSGEFIDGHQSEGEIAILLLELSKDRYNIIFEAIGPDGLEASASRLVASAYESFKNPALLLCSTLFSQDGSMLDGETLIRNIEENAGPEINIFGGMAGDDISFTGTYVFTNALSTDHGLVALVLDQDHIRLEGMAISGWKPIGVFRTATKCEENLIFTIDNQPALDIYMRFLGHDKSFADDPINFFDTVGVHYPFQIEREGRASKMCNPVGYNKEKQALICESEVPQGAKFRFSTPPEFDIIDTVLEEAAGLKEFSQMEADALLIFSCAGRLSALGPLTEAENEGLQAIWKAPMAGFFTYGEFGRGLDGKHDFHSTTNSWVALSEK